MKIAIIHDSLMVRGGAEQVARCFHEAFPDAPIFTLCYNENQTYSYFKNCNIVQTWMRFLAPNYRTLQLLFFPFGIWAMRGINIRKEYDVILLSTTHCAKYAKVPSNALVINYTYTPFRLAWEPNSYSEYKNAVGLKKYLFNLIVTWLKRYDLKSSKRTDYFIAMTNETALRIKKAYNPSNEIEIINPAVNINNFKVSNSQKDYFLIVSRLENYKKVDLAIEVFNRNGYDLVIVGQGSKADGLKAMANANIRFMNGLSNRELSELYSNAKAFVFPQYEDYGITPLEANASGVPVIAYGKGGVLDTMIPFKSKEEKCTALFFEDQTIESLLNCVEKFQTIEFDSKFIRNHAEKFSEKIFIERIRNAVNEKYDLHFKKNIDNVNNPK